MRKQYLSFVSSLQFSTLNNFRSLFHTTIFISNNSHKDIANIKNELEKRQREGETVVYSDANNTDKSNSNQETNGDTVINDNESNVAAETPVSVTEAAKVVAC